MFRGLRKTDCEKARGMLSAYIDGHLTNKECEAVESHLKGCEKCRHELESLRATVDILHLMPMVSTPRSFALERVEPLRRPRALVVLRAATAICVVLLAFVFISDSINIFEQPPVYIADESSNIMETLLLPTSDLPGFVEHVGGWITSSEAFGGEGVSGTNIPVRQIEYGLLGVVVVLGGASALTYLRARKEGSA